MEGQTSRKNLRERNHAVQPERSWLQQAPRQGQSFYSEKKSVLFCTTHTHLLLINPRGPPPPRPSMFWPSWAFSWPRSKGATPLVRKAKQPPPVPYVFSCLSSMTGQLPGSRQLSNGVSRCSCPACTYHVRMEKGSAAPDAPTPACPPPMPRPHRGRALPGRIVPWMSMTMHPEIDRQGGQSFRVVPFLFRPGCAARLVFFFRTALFRSTTTRAPRCNMREQRIAGRFLSSNQTHSTVRRISLDIR